MVKRGGLRLRGVEKAYGTGEAAVCALRGIDLDVAPGELVAILGASGSGKTTLLNVIGGIESVDAGSVCVAGEEVSARSPSALSEFRRTHIGFIFQFFNLIPTLTARENVEVVMELTGRGDRRRVPDLLAAVGLTDRADHFPAQLSGGQQQRASIARAIATEPDLLLADEPTGALDVATGRIVLGLIQQINKTGRGVVMVTHNEMASHIADRVLRMGDGRIVADELNAEPTDAVALRW
nr:ABC transporter ATP-binding protein [Gordonia asplenii]